MKHIFPVTAKSGDDRMKAGRITWVLLMAVTVSGAAGYLAEYSTVSSNVNGRELPICSVETEDAKSQKQESRCFSGVRFKIIQELS